MNNTSPISFYDQPLMELDQSSGYLEDALFEFKPKRRRLTTTYEDHLHHYYQANNQNTPPSSFPVILLITRKI